jgi:predicted transposase YbfD/YdcC
MPVPRDLTGAGRRRGLLSLGVVILYCIRDGKETFEARYFIISLPQKVKKFARSVRNHWGIENACHWCLDVTYREDESRIRAEHLRENFSWLNRFTLSLLNQHRSKEHCHETSRVRLEREQHAGNPCWRNDLARDGPASPRSFARFPTDSEEDPFERAFNVSGNATHRRGLRSSTTNSALAKCVPRSQGQTDDEGERFAYFEFRHDKFRPDGIAQSQSTEFRRSCPFCAHGRADGKCGCPVRVRGFRGNFER